MTSLLRRTPVRWISLFAALCFFCTQIVWFVPNAHAEAGAGEDLKKIEYKYYFRGDYERAIVELRAFLDRTDIEKLHVVRATEYLAASLILSGAAADGKAEFLSLMKTDASYAGPDPSVFESVVISAYDAARSEYASVIIRTAPEPEVAASFAQPVSMAVTDEKPIYKKWWFYATVGAVVLAVAGATAGGGGNAAGGGGSPDTGTVTVGINVR